MYSGQAIVLRNLRQIPPNTAKVIRLQKQFIEAVQRYQELNERPDKDERVLEELLKEISFLDKSQREELNLVREAELNHISQEIQNDLLCSEKLSDDVAIAQNGECSEDDDGLPQSPQEHRIAGTDIPPSSRSVSAEVSADMKPPAEDQSLGEGAEEPENTDEVPMDWEDLTREQWTESDRLLQKVARVGSKVLQRDFLSTIELVHVSQYKKAEEALAQKKLKEIQGKKVITTGPWQIIDIPTKVSNRRCNYLTGLHVTIRQKDPKRSVLTNSLMEPTGVKTRHHDSRGSSRASSRASSPIYLQTDSSNGKDGQVNGNNTKLLRSIKTRATKAKKLPPSHKHNNNNNHQPSSTKSSSPTAKNATSPLNCSNKSETEDSNSKNSNEALEPCVTYTLVDGVPHFKVFFPSSKDSISSPAAGSLPSTPTNGSLLASPRASVVESDIEIIQSNALSQENGTNDPHPTPERKIKSPSKLIKRPRLSHPGFTPSSSSVKSGSSVNEYPSVTISSPAAVPAAEDAANKEEIGRCLEKCGSWMGAPHFKFYRTFPSVNATVASTNWSSGKCTVTSVPPKPVAMSPAPKLSSSITTPKLVVAPNNKSASPSTPTAPLPAMPKLTIGNQALKNAQPANSSPNSPGGKFIPIAPKVSNLSSSVSNFVIVPFADKNNGNQSTAIKRPISLLKTCPPLANSQIPSSTGTFLTVKNLKECLQNGKQYKDMKVVVQKVPVQAATGTPTPSVQQAATGQRLPLSDSDDLKKKVVKLFPSPDSKEKTNGDDSQHHVSSVIVADMAM